uniref:Oxidoreductase n=1 Tax=Globisporangium ultimum (strain ATCC 200006 / CBS 805.95 / DAOM BR144) TaxID=431595 RepID=K3X2E0_GLOUD
MDDAIAVTATTTNDASADAADAACIDVSDDELAVCVSVLCKFHTSEGSTHLQTPRFRQFRLAIMPLVSDLREKLLTPKLSRTTRKERQQRKLAERTYNRERDRQLLNSTQLRAGRLAKLATVTALNPQLAQVPDGPSSLGILPQLNNDLKEEGVDAANGIDEGTRIEGSSSAATSELHFPHRCYVCNLKYKQLHHFYDRLCPPCAKLNYEKRLQTADLRDHVAIVTGARVKIGYEITLKLLRSGAMVIATTRFPKDAAYRFARERDFDAWKDKLQIYGMDFRDLGVIDKFMDHVATTFGSIDILINNATQTIRRPVHYYKHLIKSEVAPIPEELNGVEQLLRSNLNFISTTDGTQKMIQMPNGQTFRDGVTVRADVLPPAGIPSSVLLSQVAVVFEDLESEGIERFFPEGQVDVNNQQVDLRSSNSWIQKIDEIETMELVEVFAINAMAPFILNKRAIPLLEKSVNKHKFIINVSAMEGKFYRKKTPYHPHTNMAKAAANMMTRTAAADLAKRGIFMNSVDTGWINDENPRDIAARNAEANFQTPLDEIDAAVRVLDPIFTLQQPQNEHKTPIFGQFLKNFRTSEW